MRLISESLGTKVALGNQFACYNSAMPPHLQTLMSVMKEPTAAVRMLTVLTPGEATPAHATLATRGMDSYVQVC